MVVVFLDECNTTLHMGLINEILTNQSLNGRRIKEGIRLIAALNPRRKAMEGSAIAQQTCGLTYNLRAEEAPSNLEQDNDFSSLVYRVQPIPDT